MVQIVYMPNPDDFDETENCGYAFKAYEPTEVDDSRVSVISRLLINPWFAKPEDVPPARKAAWQSVRDAQAMASQHRDFATKVEADALLKAKAARAAADNVVEALEQGAGPALPSPSDPPSNPAPETVH